MTAKVEAKVKIWALLLVSIRIMITEFSVYDDPLALERLFEHAAAAQGPAPRNLDINDISWPRIHTAGLFSQWSPLPYLQMITYLSLVGVAMSPEDWTQLLSYADFSQVATFGVEQTNTFSKKTLLQIADPVPKDNSAPKLFWMKGSNRCGNGDEETTAVL
ncbi:MAG: hypothetical protein J3R72DRAFT_525758 [Linnemannia gamsii]|nr:MAG: hypothetical protein J3R72DRAFT_525758 [Linnemannia gamsii]